MTKDEALKLALEALEKWDARGRLRVIAAIKEALAQPEQEPVYLIWSEDMEGWIHGDKKQYDLTPEEGERWVLYTAPPKREWVELTATDIATVIRPFFQDGQSDADFEIDLPVYRALLDAAKELNK